MRSFALGSAALSVHWPERSRGINITSFPVASSLVAAEDFSIVENNIGSLAGMSAHRSLL
jgi:hypothetical protein